MKPIVSFLAWLLLLGPALAQTADYELSFMDEEGYPLPGVLALALPSSEFLGESQLDGGLKITGPVAGTTLQFQLLGYASKSGTPADLGLETDRVNRIVLTELSQTLATVGVIGRRNELARTMPYQVETVSQSDIAKLQSSNAADALAALSGVYVQKSQFGGGSPIVRGFEANRVLLVVDGVRMNNAIYRNGHLQNAITVDVNALSRMELIYGPGSLAYGSDALGGVIHFRTRQPAFQPASPGWNAGGALAYATAAHSKRATVNLEYGGPDVAAYTQLSLADFGDLRAGSRRPDRFPSFGARPFYLERIANRDSLVRNSEPDRQVGTAYRQLDLLQKFRFRLADKLELKANFQLSTSSDVPRYDNLSETRDGELRWAEWYYGPQDRLLASLRLEDRRSTGLFDLSSILLSQQYVAEDRFSRRNGQDLREGSEVDVYATNLQWDLAKAFSGNRSLNYGLDARYDRVENTASLFNVVTDQLINEAVATRYPSQGSTLATVGAYADYRHPLSEALTARAGLRLSRQWLKATFGSDDPIQWPPTYLEGITNAAGALTGSASLLYNQEKYRLRLLFAQGFRSPNVDDFAKFRENNGFIQVPNPELASERSNSLELGYDRELAGWRFQIAAYHTWLRQAIVRDAFRLPDGRESFVSFGDTLRVQANVNAENAKIYGLDLGVRKHFDYGLQLAAEVHWIKGTRRQRGPDGRLYTLPQDHIPPVYGQASLAYVQDKWEVRFRFRFQLAKAVEDYAVSSFSDGPDGLLLDRSGTSDNLEFTPVDPVTGAFTGTYGWTTLNLNVRRQLSERFTLDLGVENLLDRHYRTFASGVSAPGRNFLLGVSYSAF